VVELTLWVRYESYNYAQSLLDIASEIVHHFRLPALKTLVVSVDTVEDTDEFISGCKTMAKVVSDIESTTFESFQLDIGRIRAPQLPHPPIWVSRISR
jgi:hypothetical protein